MTEEDDKDAIPSHTSRSDSTVSEWELIPDPPTPTEEHKHLIPPTPTEQPKLLCGYLRKETTHSLIKTWRQRWVVFDDERCCLYYYNAKNETIPQGSIDLSNATFAYSVENMSKNQFEIQTPQCTYSFQAATQEAMFQWLDSLQKKRRKFGGRKKRDTTDKVPMTEAIPGGLVGASRRDPLEEETVNEDGVVIDSDQPIQSSSFNDFQIHKLLKRIPRPNVGRRLSSPSGGPSGGTDTVRRSNFFVNYNNIDEEQTSDTSASNSQTDLTTTSPEIPRVTRPSKKPNVQDWLIKRMTMKSYSDTELACPVCQQLQTTVQSLEEEISVKEQEVKDRDEMLEFFRKEIRLLDLQDKVRKELSDGNSPHLNDSRVDILTQRDQLIFSLQKTLEALRVENDKIETELRLKKEAIVALNEEVNLYKETLSAKDHVVMELTNKVFSLEKGGQVLTNPQEAMLPTTTKMLEQELQKLKETVDAYKAQNIFLSREIMELNDLRTADTASIKSLNGKLNELEAEHIRLKSKHIVLLKEAQTPKLSHDPDVVSQMMQEAIEQDTHTRRNRTDSETHYDIYGFKHEVYPDAEPDETLDSYARRLDQQALQTDENVASHTAKWDNFMAQFGAGRDIVPSDELKLLIRGGIPRQYKGRVWKFCVRHHVGSNYMPGMYQEILSQHANQASVALNQIELDLLRTLPSNKYYNSPDAPGIAKLRRVLVAYSWYDTTVGYCQGLNRLAAIALLFLDEEDAFWCIVAVVLHLLPPDYYNKTLLGSQTDQRVLRDFITEKMSTLGAHLDTCDIDFSLITFNWFHTIFIDNLPIETTLRIWDTFLYEGSKVLFRYALAIFKYNEESLLSQDNSIQIFNKLRSMAQDAVDVTKLTQIAFYDPMMRWFSRKKITQRRTHYRTLVESELESVSELRVQHSEKNTDSYHDIESDDEETT